MAEVVAQNRLGEAPTSGRTPHLSGVQNRLGVVFACAIQVRFQDIAFSGTRSHTPKFGSEGLVVFLLEECDFAVGCALMQA